MMETGNEINVCTFSVMFTIFAVVCSFGGWNQVWFCELVRVLAAADRSTLRYCDFSAAMDQGLHS